MSEECDDRVSRRRYEREKSARLEAETLLEHKSRELFDANQELSKHSEQLEKAVLDRTAELRVALDQAEAASSARSRFIATMSHEIRTPLGGLLGMIDLLALDEENEEKLDFLENARISGMALKRIVNDVLDFSKMEAGLFVYENESVDIRALVKSILMLAQTNLAKDTRIIEALIDNSVPQLFFGDATRIRQVISNLVSNAIRYSNDGPITISVTSTTHPIGALLRLEVSDHGLGIAEEELENLFKDFSQISNPLTAAAEGTGLGLAISKRIIEGCGGTIGVESQIGKGSTFWVELPVDVLAAPQSVAAAQPKSDANEEQIDLNGIRVLLAEDNVINQKLLMTYLNRMGIDTVLAENGRVALEKFKPGQFDLILMDVAMPEMDGLAATRHIRNKWDPIDVPPIVVLTAHVMDAIGDDAASVGIATVLSKPIPFEELRTAISDLLSVEKARGKEFPASQVNSTSEEDLTGLMTLMSVDIADGLRENFSPEFLGNLILTFVKDARSSLDTISATHASNELKLTSQEAHSLKGSALMLGFKMLADVARRVEDNASEMNSTELADNLAAANEHIDQIELHLPQRIR